MYQLTIATTEGVYTTCHADRYQASRSLLDYAIAADLYLHRDDRNAGYASDATDLTAITLLRLDSAGRQPQCVGTATITATAPVARTAPNNLAGAATS
jgi:hypothetical protein